MGYPDSTTSFAPPAPATDKNDWKWWDSSWHLGHRGMAKSLQLA